MKIEKKLKECNIHLMACFCLILCCSCVMETYDVSAPPKVIAPAPAPYIYRIYPNTGSPYYSPYFYHQPKSPYVHPQSRHQPQPNPRPFNPSHNYPGGNHTYGHR